MLFLTILACSTNQKTTQDSVPTTEEPSQEQEPANPSTEPEAQPTSEPENQPTSEPESEPAEEPEPEPEPIVVRFIALGDGGEGNDAQYQNGEAISTICAQKTGEKAGCEFAIYLGDNFYDEGVTSVYDEQFETKFELPYAILDIPFYVALGNHDYGGCLFGQCGTGWDFERSEYQVNYSNFSDKWTMPSEYYSFVKEHVTFIALDTNALMWDPWFSTGEDQYPWMEETLINAQTDWVIAYGHHPYISNGKHGNAGTYEGLEFLADWSVADVPLGAGVKDFMDAYICGQVDVYFAGHDHNRQWLEPTCGTEFIVSGAAAKTTDLEGRGNPTFYEDDTQPGFVWVEIADNCMTAEFYNEDAQQNFAQTVCR